MAEVFSDTTTVDPVASLVGEGKKFKTVEDLAKSKLEADNFINTLTGETADLKTRLAQAEAELASRKTVEEQLKAITTNKVVPSVVPVTPVPPQGQVITDEDLTNRVKAITERQTQAQTTQANVAQVTDRLLTLYGNEDKAKEAVSAKAKELGVSVKFLESAAGQSPAAFFSLIGANVTTLAPAAPRSEVNIGQLNRQSNQPAQGTYEAAREQQGRLNVKALLDPAYLRSTMKAALDNPDQFLATA